MVLSKTFKATIEVAKKGEEVIKRKKRDLGAEEKSDAREHLRREISL